MKVTFDIPEVNDGLIRPVRLLQRMFQARGPENYRDMAMLENLTNLTLNAAVEYRLGAEATKEYWTDLKSLRLDALGRAATHLETCITNVRRAIAHLEGILQDPEVLPKSNGRVPNHPSICNSKERIRLLRNAVHHQEERVLNHRIGDGEPFLLLAGGDENGELMTINRMQLGQDWLTFSELASCIHELRACAEALIEAEYG